MADDAIHEAGHALVAYHTGLKIAYVSLTHCELSLTCHDDLDSFLAAAMAGCVAAHIKNGWAKAEPGAGDLAMMAHFWPLLNDNLSGIIRPMHPGRVELARDRAETILTANWPAVESLARSLAFRGYLTGAQVVKILAEVV